MDSKVKYVRLVMNVCVVYGEIQVFPESEEEGGEGGKEELYRRRETVGHVLLACA